MSALTTHREISAEVHALEKERREKIESLIREFNETVYWPRMKAAREACALIAHRWRFTHFGPLGDPWFCCGVCRATQCRPDRARGHKQTRAVKE